METTKPRNIIADAPFDDPTDSIDLVIRTADNVDYFVLSGLLSLRSPSSFFRHVLQANQHTEERDGFPILDVKEDSETFRMILLLCYPYSSPEIKTVEQFVVVGKALTKYCMDHAWERFVKVVIASPLIREQALRVFAHAVANGWKELGEVAAKNTLHVSLDLEVELEDLRCIDALQYVRLRDYHKRCGKAAQDVMSVETDICMPWLKEEVSKVLFLHDTTKCRWVGESIFYVHDWLSDYRVALMAEVLGRPFPEIARSEDIIAQAAAKSISACGHADWTKIAGTQIHRFATLVAEEIDRLISQVPLNIDWKK
ncbi:uncharacterized protein EV420DRAFT_1474819 [Desarmillaria tabescens]|uniref:BTB domain-containing protein n=1 Tax=Armillaria tabescens TaxID=1929756 RepID=A0AA39NI18_ARMTA|nr:uncharacterized protein EV420DRAFT_1474819 [Desarmillaria tabescens]KAK0466007.1 hypothetical protein EV420DRAFT_1474819 [Desarmillaria tabescens]